MGKSEVVLSKQGLGPHSRAITSEQSAEIDAKLDIEARFFLEETLGIEANDRRLQ